MENYLSICLSFFFLLLLFRISLFFSLSRIKEKIEVIMSFYCKKVKFKFVSRLISLKREKYIIIF